MSTRLNLLPWREIRRREQDRQLLTIAVGAWLLMVVIVFYGYVHVSAMIENQSNRNKFLQDEIRKVEAELKEINEIKKKKQALIARMNIIYQLQQDRTRIVHIFDDLARKLPEGIYLTNMKQSGASLDLKGIAQSNARVSALMRNLASSDWFEEPQLEVINVKEKGSDRISEFSLKVKEATKPKEANKPKAGAKS